MARTLSFFSIVLLCLGCTYYMHSLPFDFEEEGAVLELGKELAEISGMFYKDDQSIYAIQDEKGKIYEINTHTGKFKPILSFKSKGDFEGLTYVYPHYYVLKSDGDIYKVSEDGEFEKFTFPDNKGFEFEGIALHPDKNALIVACKKHGDKDEKDFIWLYSFSLEKEHYMQDPFLKYSKDDVHDKFQASGISFDEEGKLYLISAKSFTIAAFDSSLQLIDKAQLPYLRYPQVEGICFAPDGTLYLSSEKGDQNKGKLIILRKE